MIGRRGKRIKKRGIKDKQKNAGWDPAYLLRLPGLSVSLDGSPAQALLKSDPGWHSVFHAFALGWAAFAIAFQVGA
ncbi:MAG: hypothetical protein R6X19_10580 [Kiritimatiellia bacterium]